MLDLVEADESVADVARDLGSSAESTYTWRRQERIDGGRQPGLTSAEKSELTAAKRRIAELEAELTIHHRASELLGKVVSPKAVLGHRGDGGRGAAGAAACRVLGVSESGYHDALSRPPPVRAIRHAWLTDQIRAVHVLSNGTYGARGVHGELTLGRAAWSTSTERSSCQ